MLERHRRRHYHHQSPAHLNKKDLQKNGPTSVHLRQRCREQGHYTTIHHHHTCSHALTPKRWVPGSVDSVTFTKKNNNNNNNVIRTTTDQQQNN